MPKARRTLFAVVGMHRSGTSALARVMNLLGPPLPEPLLLGMPDNPLGHWEPLELLDLDTRALAAAGCSWDSGPLERAGDALLADPALRRRATSFLCRCFSRGNLAALVKDPRQTVVLPSWLALADELGIETRIALIFRDPVEVARSLAARDGIAIEAGLDLWRRYNRLGEAYSRGVPRILVDYADLRRDPEAVVARLLPFMGEAGAYDPAAAASVAAGTPRDDAAPRPELPAEVAETSAALKAAAAGDAVVGLG